MGPAIRLLGEPVLHTPAAVMNDEPRHHQRAESSGDEAPLEMTVRVRPKNPASAEGRAGDDGTGRGKGGKQGNGKKKMNGRAGSDKDDKVARLASHEDLLSRRMMGLTGNLTGAATEE